MDPKVIFDTQGLLFDKWPASLAKPEAKIPDSYYNHGWTIVDNVSSELEAVNITEDFIKNIDASKFPLASQFQDRIKLAKADHIPVCDDIVSTSFQVLHFDMGHPFIESDGQLLITHVGIYLPKSTTDIITARTRLVELDGLLSPLNLTAKEIEQKLMQYVKSHGDGWSDTNTFRLACFARFLDALSDNPELQDQKDKTVGQWFQNERKVGESDAWQNEADFYAKHGVKLDKIENQIALEPGQLLILDNSRVIHGRIGKRKAKELFNFMFGIKEATHTDINLLRSNICDLVK